ncbi:hypothetical protein WICPIJ_003475 [Wickerhamomyces pijperi]|uniref:Uncharacterized protein n=1 Tax=Wickerhamomyces pijperi TaxID=599730 RepID=A0A9P8TNU3_WICPI|nr:hypothetical protein WICPIJ_003475 [Wickerhamomyces pijperi]
MIPNTTSTAKHASTPPKIPPNVFPAPPFPPDCGVDAVVEFPVVFVNVLLNVSDMFILNVLKSLRFCDSGLGVFILCVFKVSDWLRRKV